MSSELRGLRISCAKRPSSRASKSRFSATTEGTGSRLAVRPNKLSVATLAAYRAPSACATGIQPGLIEGAQLTLSVICVYDLEVNALATVRALPQMSPSGQRPER